jgi:VWFA-related protein
MRHAHANLVCVGVLLGAVVALRAQDVTFSSRIEAVRVDVLVTDGGVPVRGLERGDFEVRDNGVLQQVDLVSFEQIPLNVILALDMSDSVAGDRLTRLRDASGAVLAGLKPEDQAALLTFNHVVQLGAKLTKNIDAVRRALDGPGFSGGTALVDTTYTGITIGESDAGRALLIIFSDGLDTASWLSADKVLDAAKRSDVVAYAVATRSPGRPDFLRDLTSFTAGHLFEVDGTERLDAVFTGILDEFRRRYLVSYTPRGVAKGGWHRLDVSVRRKSTVKARPGYQS